MTPSNLHDFNLILRDISLSDSLAEPVYRDEACRVPEFGIN